MLPASSIVRYEMHRRASSSYGATIAPVGQAEMHAVQVPQCAVTGSVSGSGRSADLAQEEIRACARQQQQRAHFPPRRHLTGALSVNTR
jgi:hypothetical protein